MLQLITYAVIVVSAGMVLTSACYMRDSKTLRAVADVIAICIVVPFGYCIYKCGEGNTGLLMLLSTIFLFVGVVVLQRIVLCDEKRKTDGVRHKLAPSKYVCIGLVAVVVAAVAFRDRNAYHARITMQKLEEMERDDVRCDRIWTALGLPFGLGGAKNGVEIKQKERDVTVFRKSGNVTFKLVADDAPVPIKNDFFDHKLVTIDKTDGSVYEAKYFRFYTGTNSVEECARAIPGLLDRLERDLGGSFACRHAHRKPSSAQVKDELRYLFQFPHENTISEWQCDIDRYRMTLSSGITENGRVLLMFKVKRSDGYEVSL